MKTYEFSDLTLSAWPANEQNGAGFRLYWVCPAVGFGTLDFWNGPDGSILVDDEFMSSEFVLAALAELARRAKPQR